MNSTNKNLENILNLGLFCILTDARSLKRSKIFKYKYCDQKINFPYYIQYYKIIKFDPITILVSEEEKLFSFFFFYYIKRN